MGVDIVGWKKPPMRYLYRCNNCGNEFDVEIKLKSVINAARPPKILCPKCGRSSRKLINVPTVHYKGNGFYSTDNKIGNKQ